GVEHGAEILQKRVARALHAFDPEVLQAAERLKASRKALEECKNALVSAEAELTECGGVLVELSVQLSSLELELHDIKSNTLLDSDILPLVRESIRRREDANTVAKRQLDKKQSNITPPITPETFDLAKNYYDT